jgi:hypothetical protein
MLTNYINHYKEKMFLEMGSENKGSSQHNPGNAASMSIEDMQSQAISEKNEITIDFE